MTDLTEADRGHIRIIWKQLFADPEANGRAVVLRLFKDYPETKKYFKTFKNISTEEEMQKSAQIKRHGKAVMNRLNDLIENLENWDEACDIMTHLAERHVHVHKVGVHNFRIIFNVILTILTETLGEGFKPEIREAWEKLFNIIYNYLENSYKKIEAAS